MPVTGLTRSVRRVPAAVCALVLLLAMLCAATLATGPGTTVDAAAAGLFAAHQAQGDETPPASSGGDATVASRRGAIDLLAAMSIPHARPAAYHVMPRARRRPQLRRRREPRSPDRADPARRQHRGRAPPR